MRYQYQFALLALVFFSVFPSIQGQQPPTVIAVDAAHPGPAISPEMFGIFFEDINFGADGGLYPERVKNRSFEFSDPLMARKPWMSIWFRCFRLVPGRI